MLAPPASDRGRSRDESAVKSSRPETGTTISASMTVPGGSWSRQAATTSGKAYARSTTSSAEDRERPRPCSTTSSP